MFFPVSEWFPSFLLTLIVEIPVAVLLLRHSEPRVSRVVVLVTFANVATHPSVWFVFTQLFLVGTPEYVVAAETWAVAVETVFYSVTIAGLTPSRALTASVVANAASFVVGRILAQGWPGAAG
jgi:hypothetical protein